MSLASDYAATQAQAAANLVTANQAVPPQLDGPNATFVVTAQGNLRVIAKGSGPVEASPAAALAVAAWIVQTFG